MKKLVICIGLLSLLHACARNPVTGRRELVLISESQEIALGADAAEQARAEFGVVENPAIQEYVTRIGRTMAAVSNRPGLPWEFTVVDSPVVNAFALPGGHIYFTRGILVYFNNEAEVAGVMGHEIAHVAARHSVQQLSRAQLAQLGIGVGAILSPTFGAFADLAGGGLGLLFLRFSRDAEREADRVGIGYAAAANYDPRQASGFFDLLTRLSDAEDRESLPGWLSTHPDPGERREVTEQLAEEQIRLLNLEPDRMTVGRDLHLQRIDGLVFGDNPREGFVEGSRFLHPDMEFELTAPEGWPLDNTRASVLITEPSRNAQIQLTLPEVPAGTTPQQYARLLEQEGIRAVRGGTTEINGNPAFVGVYALGNGLAAKAAFIQYRQRIFQVLGVTPALDRFEATFDRTLGSFRRLTDGQALSVQPDRLEIRPARAGETIAAIARDMNHPRVNATRLALLNRIPEDQSLSAGTPVKVVTRGY